MSEVRTGNNFLDAEITTNKSGLVGSSLTSENAVKKGLKEASKDNHIIIPDMATMTGLYYKKHYINT